MSTAFALRLTNSSSISALAFLVWDICVTFDDEVNRIWTKPHSHWIKWVFVFVRWFTVVLEAVLLFASLGTPNASTCRQWFLFRTIAPPFVTFAAQFVLIARVRAMYSMWMPITISLYCLYCASCINILVIAIFFGSTLPLTSFCTPVPTPATKRFLSATLVSISILESLLFALTLFKIAQAVQSGRGRAPIYGLILRDGTWSFFLQFFVMIANAALSNSNSPDAFFLFNWYLTVLSFSSARLVLNMESLAARTTSAARLSVRRPSRSWSQRPREEGETAMELTTHLSFGGMSAIQEDWRTLYYEEI